MTALGDARVAPGAPGAGTVPTAVAVPLRAATAVSVSAVAVVLVVGLVVPGVWERWGWLPFAVGLLVGIPHGALDHLVPWWTGATARRPGLLAGVLSAYVALAVLTFVAARLWPVPALVGLLVGSAVHFGSGETAVQALRSGRPAGPTPRWVAPGLATVAVPFLAWPTTVRPVLDVLAPGSAAVVLDPTALLVVGTGTAVAVVVTLAADLLAGRRAAAGELALLTALFLVVPPLPAFGLYFGAWHGLRHLARLVALDPGNAGDLARRRLARPVGRVLRQAALPTAAVLAVLVVLLAVPGLAGRAAAGLVPAGLALVLALTVPHMAVVAVMDRRQRPAAQFE
ncbi:Brp/Blh family beta-carotene 15,15'-dioxygenase [Actinomycetospora sp. NBRC 106378]|uniref:Brp/Blh family beta-carotene 15,15'-dioxygenase n=1 Tax=Actinomycetospora sp. NBRC 106378 TaxID=3032208 RepID=UPI0024A40849|nr:Brp/Blh family beta-carotene 15,15'-dioxygenase [Actinomycetospora sp. NBRC 106378]GLZ56300.1 beta-carotene 15,15'-dioxygenase [Actinomycetospora sp. NBRC 106378]